ncbi:MAG TPA: BTAD domain-containing putative transcriptional regulator [Blastocatellia bacterium]|nr:BTAD domain-containing putative transcriptional regulator [Blastocatellia bacterium]
MVQQTHFLGAKLMPPRVTPTLLPRQRLVDRLVANLVRSVTLVAANAGSGKTTLIADFLRSHTRPFVWYQLDQTDAYPSVFLGYITHGIRRFHPDFGRATLAYLKQSAAEIDQHPERAVDVFLNEVLDTIEQQLIVVLDDYHQLGITGSVHAAVDRLLAYLPDVIHTIIISRDMPPLQLARLRSQGSLAIIDRDDLRFTPEETQALFRNVFDMELVPEQLAEYTERTQGWITGLQLVQRVLQRSAAAVPGGKRRAAVRAAPDLAEILRQSEREIFEYFAEEVFGDESDPVRNLLLRLSLLERIDSDLCGSLFPEAYGRAILPSLVRRNIFITSASDGHGEVHRLHPLFRNFLKSRFYSEVGKAGVAAEHVRMADYYLTRGNWERAIHHLIEAEEFERAARVIAEKGEAWIASGALALLVSAADAVPPEILERHPRALIYRAEVALRRGEQDLAQTWLRRAAALLHQQHDPEGEGDALHSLAAIARRRSDLTAAFEHLGRAIDLVDERSAVRAKCANTRGLCFAWLDQFTDAEQEFRMALQLAEEHGDVHLVRMVIHNLGVPPLLRGDFSEALRWLRQYLRDDQQAHLPQEAIAHLNLARCYLYRGEMEQSERHLDRALDCCQTFNLIPVRAETFETYGDWYREQGDVARATEFYDRAERDYEGAVQDLARRELNESRAMLKLNLGDLAAALNLQNQLINARQALQDEKGTQTATLARGRILIAQGQYETARIGLEPALLYFRQHGLYYYEAQACLELAACESAAGREDQVLERLRRMLELTKRYDYDYWLRREVTAHPQLFALPEAAELLPPDLREQLASPASLLLLTRSRAASSVPKPHADLTINMLGPVEIYRDPLRPFAADAWTTKRARDILCFIASRRHRRASKDTIIEVFWGEAEFESVAKNFHPTVSHIRKALNSNQPLKQNFLLYRDGDYQLNADYSYAIDTVEFERFVTEGEAARRASQHERFIACYEAAVQLYRGEFMQGCYDEWVEEQRSYYREQYLHMLEALVVVAQRAKEWPRSLHLAQQILRDDPFREDIHCLIMRAHAAQGNRVAVKEQYEDLRQLLGKELGVEPAAETQKIFKQLLAQ